MAKGNKFFKLGEGATLFVDPSTGKKLVGDRVEEFTPQQMSSEKFKVAKKNGHIELADEPDEDEVNTDSAELKAFKLLKADDMRKKILDEYELEEDEIAEVNKANKADLVTRYTELLEAE